jgi:hypothetical protein
MFTRHILHPILTALVRLTTGLSMRLRQLREQPDAGMETADKILWAAVMTLVASGVGFVFKTKLEEFANNLSVTLGW